MALSHKLVGHSIGAHPAGQGSTVGMSAAKSSACFTASHLPGALRLELEASFSWTSPRVVCPIPGPGT